MFQVEIEQNYRNSLSGEVSACSSVYSEDSEKQQWHSAAVIIASRSSTCFYTGVMCSCKPNQPVNSNHSCIMGRLSVVLLSCVMTNIIFVPRCHADKRNCHRVQFRVLHTETFQCIIWFYSVGRIRPAHRFSIL